MTSLVPRDDHTPVPATPANVMRNECPGCYPDCALCTRCGCCCLCEDCNYWGDVDDR